MVENEMNSNTLLKKGWTEHMERPHNWGLYAY